MAVFVIIALVNASNLTDGLDGLDSGVSLIIMGAFTIIITYLSAGAFAAGDSIYGEQLKMLATFCAIAAGAALGFLRFNIYPRASLWGYRLVYSGRGHCGGHFVFPADAVDTHNGRSAGSFMRFGYTSGGFV